MPFKERDHRKMGDNLPEYANPPVNEVICGITFKSLGGFLAPHIGQFWETVRGTFPNCQEHAALQPVLEAFGPAALRVEAWFEVPSIPRVWFLTNDETRLIQLQRDRFLYNWKKVNPEDQYPRFPIVFAEFEKVLTGFEAFLNENDLGAVEPTQFELTYINHIPKGEGWDGIHEVGNVFADFSWRDEEVRFLPPPEGINWHTTFAVPDKSCRLHVQIQHATRVSDQREIIIFNLTARGIGTSAATDAMKEWFTRAREWIVRGFADLTGDEVQRTIWGRKQ